MLKVNIFDYYPNAHYDAYMKGGKKIAKPSNTTLEVGMLMYDEVNNSIGMILGNIDEFHCEDLRLDSDGMQPIENLRLASMSDFTIEGVKFQHGLDKVNGRPQTMDDLNDISLGMVEEMVLQGILPNCQDTDDETEWNAQDVINEKLAIYFGLDYYKLQE
jgi:hypothetical protein